jgi:hypothetical protein
MTRPAIAGAPNSGRVAEHEDAAHDRGEVGGNRNATFVPRAEPNASARPAIIAPYSQATRPGATGARVTDDRAQPSALPPLTRDREHLAGSRRPLFVRAMA